MSETQLSTVILICGIIGAATFVLGSGEHAAENVWRKIKLAGLGVLHMLLSRDKKFKSEFDSANMETDRGATKKQVIFLRHGESEWNEVFNRGFGPSFLTRFLKALIRELMMLPTRDSVFFDSPLSNYGIKQAQELLRFLQMTPESFESSAVADVVTLLRGGDQSQSCVMVTSNLRRAIATGLIGLWDRLRGGKERFVINSALQEVTFNVDGISLLEAGETPDEGLAKDLGGEVSFDIEFNSGTKSLSNTGMVRIKNFAEWVMNRPEETVIAVGHSLFFRSFFRMYLPQSVVNDAKKRKIVNCGVVAFTLERGVCQGRPAYRIDPASIVNVYGGFK